MERKAKALPNDPELARGQDPNTVTGYTNNSGSSRRSLTLIAIITLVVLGLGSLWVRTRVPKGQELEDRRYNFMSRRMPEGGNYSMDSKMAFVFGGQGVYESSELFKCLAAMESLSKIGGWKGHIYFLMGSTACLPSGKLHDLIENNNIHVVKVTEQEVPSIMPRRQNNELRMAIKTEIWKYVDPAIETVLWYDCDVLFVHEGCVAEMVRKKPLISDEKPFYLSWPVHVGSFASSPTISGKYLEVWRKGLEKAALEHKKGEWIQDFVIFADLFGKDPSLPETKWGLMDKAFHDVFPQHISASGELQEGTTKCAVHLSTGRCAHLGADNIHNLVRSLDLKSTEGRGWCPSKWRRMIKSYGYTWPFCWNPPFIWDGSGGPYK